MTQIAQLDSPLSNDILQCSVQTSQGDEVILGEVISEKAALIVFIRHFGCIGCSENITLLAQRFDELTRLNIKIMVIGCGPYQFIESFKERHNLLHSEAVFLTDKTLNVQKNVGLKYSLWSGFKPKALFEMGRAYVNGHVSDVIQGDIKQQAGAIFVDASGRVKLFHRSQSLGDHVNTQQIMNVALSSWVATNDGLT
jgi:peroxiredoxin